MAWRLRDHAWFMVSGEIHYFRIPRANWRERLVQAREAGLNTVATHVPWRLHEPTEGAFDLEPIAAWIEAVRAEDLKLFIRVGPVSNAEMVNEGLPDWLAGDPDSRPRGSPGGGPALSGPSYNSPRFLKATEKWYEALLPLVSENEFAVGGPIIAVQLCDKIGVFSWISRVADRTPHVEDLYRQFLRERYRSIEALRLAYDDLSPSDFHLLAQPDNAAPASNLLRHLDRARFVRHYHAAYFFRLAELARAHGIRGPLIADVPMFREYDTRGRGHQAPLTVSLFSQFATAVPEVSLGVTYQIGRLDHENSHDIAIATEAARMAVSAIPDGADRGEVVCVELQAGAPRDRPRIYPSDVDLTLRLASASGVAGVNAYMFAGGRNAEKDGAFGPNHEWQAPIASDGTKRPHFETISEFGRFISGMGAAFAATEKTSVTSVGFYAPYWMTELIDGPEIARIRKLREQVAFDGVWRLLDLAGRPFDFVDLERDLPERVTSLWVFSLDRMDSAVQARLAAFTRGGGRLAIWPSLPSRDWRGRACSILKDALGLSPRPHARELLRASGDARFISTDLETVFRGADDDVLADCRDGEVAALIRRCGEGLVLFMGFGLEDNFHYWRGVFAHWCDRLGVPALMRVHPPGEINTVLRTGPEGSFLTIANAHETPVRAAIELPSLAASWGGLDLPPRSAWILPLDVSFRFSTGHWVLETANAEVTDAAEVDSLIRIRFRTPALGERFEAVLRKPDGTRVHLDADARAGECLTPER
jgi:beta-galactosidase